MADPTPGQGLGTEPVSGVHPSPGSQGSAANMDHGIVWGHISIQGKALCELEATLESFAKLFCRKTHRWKTF